MSKQQAQAWHPLTEDVESVSGDGGAGSSQAMQALADEWNVLEDGDKKRVIVAVRPVHEIVVSQSEGDDEDE